MEIRIFVFALCCAAASLSLKAQQEAALPPVVPKHVSLADAAANNDYTAFAALYESLQSRGKSVAAYTPLYDLWTWSVTDSGGEFYGREMYEKLANLYVGFEDYIAQYAAVDDAGNTVWPVSETRAFLLERAREAKPAIALPKVRVRSGEVPASGTVKPAAEAAAAPPPRVTTPVVVVEEEEPQKSNGALMLLLIAIFGVGLFALFMRSEPVDIRAIESPESDEPQPHSLSSPDRSHLDADVLGLRG